MKFKEFLQKEDMNSNEKGLMGFPKSSSIRKPSDGQPFAKYLSSVAGAEPRGNGGATQPMFMKKMKKR